MSIFVKKMLSNELTKNPIIIKIIPNFESYLNSSNILEKQKPFQLKLYLVVHQFLQKLMKKNIISKVVMVTGAGGQLVTIFVNKYYYTILKQLL